jgi:hypothetical protein
MAHEIIDFQGSAVTVANTNVETAVFNYTVLANSINTVSLYRLMLTGTLSSKLVTPGTITLRHKFGSLEVAVMTETPNVNLSGVGFICNLDCWIMPGSSANVVAVGGFVSQSGGDLFLPSGVRSSSAAAAKDLTVNNLITTTVQWQTADANNSFTRSIAALITLTG